VTGARADRRELNRMLGKLIPGDIVTVTRIDRLVRSTFDLFAIVKRIADAKAQSVLSRNRGPTPAPAPDGLCWPYSAAWPMLSAT
jgi:DNA invertase Pin-like site-specific DNA recombinase